MIYTSQNVIDEFEALPERVVSLVPSVSDSLFALGLSSKVVGITDYCPSPDPSESEPRRVGGTKNPDPDLIKNLSPDLVIANQEENDRAQIDMLAEAGLKIWLTFPKSIDAAIVDLRILGRIFGLKQNALAILELLEKTYDWMRLANLGETAPKFFCPIWEDNKQTWWMTFNDQTFAHDILSLCGGVNAFAERERKYPLSADLGKTTPKMDKERDTRYPRVSMEEVVQSNPEIVILPSEPYTFREKDVKRISDLLSTTPAAQNGNIVLIDGRLITWHGVNMAHAFDELPRIFEIM
ncbi:MAG: ABC transporter substrate-binding protein [Chloroflexi bacterium]|nr:ABC transporter substrate-binding protein [Chloroflexota bacterium]